MGLHSGEGDMITTSNAPLAAALRLRRSQGEESRYHHVRLGFNFRLTDMAAALGREQLRILPRSLRQRHRNASFLTRALAGLPGISTPYVIPGVTHAFNLYTLRIDPEILRISRGEFQQALARRGVESAVHYPLPLHRQPLFEGYGDDTDYPVSTRLARTVLFVPVHPGLSQSDLRYITQGIRAAVSSRLSSKS